MFTKSILLLHVNLFLNFIFFFLNNFDVFYKLQIFTPVLNKSRLEIIIHHQNKISNQFQAILKYSFYNFKIVM